MPPSIYIKLEKHLICLQTLVLPMDWEFLNPSVQVFADHKALEHMLEGKFSDKLYQWVLILLKYNLDVKVHIMIPEFCS